MQNKTLINNQLNTCFFFQQLYMIIIIIVYHANILKYERSVYYDIDDIEIWTGQDKKYFS
jgi:hypothetical protein